MRSKKFDRSIVEGPIGQAVWKLAWPTMLQNVIAGLQGIIDHAMVGHFVGYTANAAIGVSWQIILVVIVFISSLFTGMAVLVARFAGANESDKVNRVVYQAFLTAFGLSIILAVIGYFAAPPLLVLVNAAPDVKAEALPFLRAMFMGIFGMMMFFMLSGAFRAAGDPRTPLRLGVIMTVLTIVFNVVLIPMFGTIGAAFGTIASSTTVAIYGIWQITRPDSVIHFERGMDMKPDFAHHPVAVPLRPADRRAGYCDEHRWRADASFHRFARAQRCCAGGLRGWLHRALLADHMDLGRSHGRVGDNCRAESGSRQPERAVQGVHVASRYGLAVAAAVGLMFLLIPGYLLAIFGMTDPLVLALGRQLLAFLSVSGLFITVALSYTGGLQGTGDTRSPLYISIVSQVVVPLGLCTVFQAMYGLDALHIWIAILIGHATRATLSVLRFRQGKWRGIAVDIEPARP